MDVDQPDLRKFRRRGHRSCHGIGDVVEFQIEEYIEA
jgi:hypothetical protein